MTPNARIQSKADFLSTPEWGAFGFTLLRLSRLAKAKAAAAHSETSVAETAMFSWRHALNSLMAWSGQGR
eukprot:9713741-Alexandrium_andersonii.AAC.1